MPPVRQPLQTTPNHILGPVTAAPNATTAPNRTSQPPPPNPPSQKPPSQPQEAHARFSDPPTQEPLSVQVNRPDATAPIDPTAGRISGDSGAGPQPQPQPGPSRLKSTGKKNSGDEPEKKRTTVHFPSDDLSGGNWQHLKKKTRRYDHEARLKGKDHHFHIDIATECEPSFEGQRMRNKEKRMEHFAFIVDLDAYEYHKVVFHSFLNEVLQSSFFRFSILILVLINALQIGLQTDAQITDDWNMWFHIVDQIILAVFLFEIIVKWIYDFRLFWKVWWNIMDFVIVGMIIMAAVIPSFGNSRVVVVVRVVRAFRSLRSVSFLSSLSIVTHTIVKSVADMGNILLVLMIFMLVMSVMGVILFEIEELSTRRFLSAVDAWFVLFICVTQDGWNQVLDEFRNPKKYFPLLAIYLIFAVSIGAFVFSNLIVSVIVANLELSVKELREERKLLDNPLEFHVNSENELEIQPVYDLLSKHNVHILAQRPLRIPNLRKFSPRRIHTYITLIVALEQNMLEAEIIQTDMEKIMAVMLSVILQLSIHSQQRADEDELKRTWSESMAHAKRIDGAINLFPDEPPQKARPHPQPQGSQPPQGQGQPKRMSARQGTGLTQLPSARRLESAANISFLQQVKNRHSAENLPKVTPTPKTPRPQLKPSKSKSKSKK